MTSPSLLISSTYSTLESYLISLYATEKKLRKYSPDFPGALCEKIKEAFDSGYKTRLDYYLKDGTPLSLSISPLTENRVLVYKRKNPKPIGVGSKKITYKAHIYQKTDTCFEKSKVALLKPKNHKTCAKPIKWCLRKSPYITSPESAPSKKYKAIAPLAYKTFNPKERFSFQCLIKIIKDILNGGREIHAQGLLHSDIKPANILLFHSGTPPYISATITDVDTVRPPGVATTAYQSLNFLAPENRAIAILHYNSTTLAPTSTFNTTLASLYCLGGVGCNYNNNEINETASYGLMLTYIYLVTTSDFTPTEWERLRQIAQFLTGGYKIPIRKTPPDEKFYLHFLVSIDRAPSILYPPRDALSIAIESLERIHNEEWEPPAPLRSYK